MTIERLILPNGIEIRNVPASPEVLNELGIPSEKIERLLFVQAQRETKQNIQSTAARARAAILGRIDVYKLLSWNVKAARAQRILHDSASTDDIEVLTVEATARARGESPHELAKKQATKSAALAKIMVTIDGLENVALKAIEREVSRLGLHTALQQFKQNLTTAIAKNSNQGHKDV